MYTRNTLRGQYAYSSRQDLRSRLVRPSQVRGFSGAISSWDGRRHSPGIVPLMDIATCRPASIRPPRQAWVRPAAGPSTSATTRPSIAPPISATSAVEPVSPLLPPHHHEDISPPHTPTPAPRTSSTEPLPGDGSILLEFVAEAICRWYRTLPASQVLEKTTATFPMVSQSVLVALVRGIGKAHGFSTAPRPTSDGFPAFLSSPSHPATPSLANDAELFDAIIELQQSAIPASLQTPMAPEMEHSETPAQEGLYRIP